MRKPRQAESETPADVVSLLEVTASETPRLLPLLVDLLLQGPARLVVLQLGGDWDVPDASRLIARAAEAAAGVDRLESAGVGRRWQHPRDVLAGDVPSVGMLRAFAEARLMRKKRTDRAGLRFVIRQLDKSLGGERAERLVRECLAQPAELTDLVKRWIT